MKRKSCRTFLGLTMLLILMLLPMYLLSGCAAKPPGEKELEATFTEDFLTEVAKYRIDGIEEEFSIDDVTLVRRQTNEKQDVSDCTISLSHPSYRCEVNVTLHYEYYDEGGWFLEEWKINDTQMQPLQGVSSGVSDYAENELKRFYPNAVAISGETGLKEIDGVTTDVYAYKVPYLSVLIGDTGMELVEGGIIKIVFRFSALEGGYAWIEDWDASSFSQHFSHYRGAWRPLDDWPGFYTNSLYIDALNMPSIFTASISMTSNYDASGYETANETAGIVLERCVAGTKMEEVLPAENVVYNSENYDFQTTECLYYGVFTSYSQRSNGPYFACILITDNGVFLAEVGKQITKADGSRIIKYHAINSYG